MAKAKEETSSSTSSSLQIDNSKMDASAIFDHSVPPIQEDEDEVVESTCPVCGVRAFRVHTVKRVTNSDGTTTEEVEWDHYECRNEECEVGAFGDLVLA